MNGITRWHGICRGGPYNKRHVTEFRTVFAVGIDMDDPQKRTVPGLQGRTKRYNARFGVYRWNETDGAWDWDGSRLTQTETAKAAESVDK